VNGSGLKHTITFSNACSLPVLKIIYLNNDRNIFFRSGTAKCGQEHLSGKGIFIFIAYFYKKHSMKYFFTLAFLFAVATACKQKVLSGPELEKKLIKTMQDYLDKDAKPGSKFKVEDVNFYADKIKKEYNCEFHVFMHVDKLDTTGIMKANIPNDFSKVTRLQ
jgi:hypothetical protein